MVVTFVPAVTTGCRRLPTVALLPIGSLAIGSPDSSYFSKGGGRGGGPAYDDIDLIHDRHHQQQRDTIGLLAPGSGDIAPPDASGYGRLSTTPHGRVPIGSLAIGSPDSSYSSNGGGRGGRPAYDDLDLIHDRRHQQQRVTIGLLAPGSGDIAPPDASGYGGLSTTPHGRVPIGSLAIGSPDSSLYDDVERFSERFNPEHQRTDINVDSYRRFIPRQVHYEDVEFVHPHRNSSSLIRDVRYDEVKFVGDLHATQQHPTLYSPGFLLEELPDTSSKEADHSSKDEYVEIAPNGFTAVYNGVRGTFFPHHNKIEETVPQKSVHKDHPTSIKISA
eukprot:scaffold71866_cov33-Attheya_sp.AAC.1